MSRTRRQRRRHDDDGAVTVEAAVALTAFVLFLGMALSALAAAVDNIRCVDAAREAARLAAQGETEQAVEAAARIAPDGAKITIDGEGKHIAVTVVATPGVPLPGIHLHEEAFAVREPDG